MKRKNKILMLTSIAFGFVSLIGNAQVAQNAQGNNANDRPDYGGNINSSTGVVIIADNNNDRNRETIRFAVGRYNNGANYTAEITRRGLNLFGLQGQAFYDINATKGLNFLVNSDNANGDFNYRFRASSGGDIRTILEMSYDNGFNVNTGASFEGTTVFENTTTFEDTNRFNGNSGFGMSNPSEKIHVRDGNVRVDTGQYQSWGPVVLHPDTDRTGDDSIEFLNSSNERMASIQDGELFLRRETANGGVISSNGALRFQPDNDNTGNDRIIFLNQNRREMARIQDGVITTDEIRLNVTTFPDYVFAKDYKLMSLKDVDAYIKANKHLPNMPTEAEVVANGMNVSKINTVLVEKVEELTLHTINQEKQMQSQEQKIALLLKRLETLEAAINR